MKPYLGEALPFISRVLSSLQLFDIRAITWCRGRGTMLCCYMFQFGEGKVGLRKTLDT